METPISQDQITDHQILQLKNEHASLTKLIQDLVRNRPHAPGLTDALDRHNQIWRLLAIFAYV